MNFKNISNSKRIQKREREREESVQEKKREEIENFKLYANWPGS